MSNGEVRDVLPIRSDVQAQAAQRKNKQQEARDSKPSIWDLPPAEQYGRVFENIADLGGETPGSQSLGEFAGNVVSDVGKAAQLGGALPAAVTAVRSLGANAAAQDTGQPTSDPGAEAARIEMAETEQFVAGVQQRVQETASNFKLFETLYADGNLSPQAQTALDEAYDQSVIGVDQLNDEINNKLAQIQISQDMTGFDPETMTVAPADVHNAGLVPGVGGAAARDQSQGTGGTTPEQAAIGGVFERATARAMETQPNVQGTSGPFTFVRGGAESDSQRQMQEDQIRDFIGQADDLAIQGAGGQDISSQADSLASQAAEAQMNALGVEDQFQRHLMQVTFEQQVRQDIDNLVQQRQDIVNNFEDVETALAEEDLAQGSQKFNLSFDPTPEGAYLDAFETRMDEFLTNQGFEETVPGQYDAILDVASQVAAMDDTMIQMLETGVTAEGGEQPEFLSGEEGEEGGEVDPASAQAVAQIEQAINQTAQRFGIDALALKNEAISARGSASRIFQEVQDVGSAKRLNPGSHSAAYAIYQEAAPRLGDEGGQMLANSPAFHELIKVASGGKAGQEKGGNIAGIGGLTRDTYEAMGVDYDSIKGDLQAELGALIDFVVVNYGGDPVAALSDFRDKKVWGRTDAPSLQEQVNTDLMERR